MSSNGLAIIEVNESETRSVFIDQDALECAKLNALTKKRAREEAKKRQREAKLEAKRRADNARTVRYDIGCCTVSAAVTLTMFAGLVHPVVSVPVAVICLCAACVRLGAWLGRNANGR